MRIANVIIAHKNPEQLYLLVSQYPKEHFHNWIHLDARCNLDDYSKVLNLPNVTLSTQLRKVAWAGYSFIAVTVEAFHEIRKSGERFMYINLMSGMDFPIKPTPHFYNYLLESYQGPRHEFFHITDVHTTWPAAFRYEKIHFNEWTTLKGRYFTQKIINSLLPKRKFYHGKMTAYGRSAWFTATHEFIDFALDFFAQNPDYLRFFKTVWCPDELVFSSLVMASPFKERIFEHNLRLIDWSEGNANPKTFQINDFESIVKSEKYIARKFDESVDSTIVPKLREFISEKN